MFVHSDVIQQGWHDIKTQKRKRNSVCVKQHGLYSHLYNGVHGGRFTRRQLPICKRGLVVLLLTSVCFPSRVGDTSCQNVGVDRQGRMNYTKGIKERNVYFVPKGGNHMLAINNLKPAT